MVTRAHDYVVQALGVHRPEGAVLREEAWRKPGTREAWDTGSLAQEAWEPD